MNGAAIANGKVFNKTGSELRDLIFQEFVSKFGISKEIYDKEISDSKTAILLRDGMFYLI